jgi:hypothetical protein
MARASADFQTFQGKADAGGNFVSAPFDDGQEFKAAASVFANLGATLGQIADKAAQKAGIDAGKAAANDAVALPDISYKLKAGGAGAAESQAVIHASNLSSHHDKADLIRAAAAQIGANPVDYATAISYETGGTFSTKIKGGKNGDYQGIIQFGPAERAKYGVHGGQTFAEQLQSANSYFQDRGFKPGMGMLDLYSTINAGSPGHYNASDGPGNTVRSHVEKMLASGHRARAEALLGQVTIGGDVAGLMPAAPLTNEYQMQVDLPAPKPMALRKDGTIFGDAFDGAMAETAAWKMQAGLDAELGAAYDANKDNPQAFAASVKDVTDRYVKQADAIAPDVSLAIKQRASQHLITMARDVQSRNEIKVDNERKQNASAALIENTKGLERQAYLIGTNENGDQQLSDLSAQANASIDRALQSRAITAEEAAKQREGIAGGLVTSRIQGVFDALPDVNQKKHFVESLDAAYADPKSPLAALQPDTFRRIKEALTIDARQQADKANASTALEKYTLKRSMADDLASMENTGKGASYNGAPLDATQVARILGPDDAAQWLDQRTMGRKLFEATHTMAQQDNAQIEHTLAGLEPKAGEDGFALKQKVFEEAQKKAHGILKQRFEDPAAAAEITHPEISKIEDPRQRAQMRMDAQAAMGLSEAGRNPLTRQEAQQFSGRINLVEDNPDALDSEMRAIMNDAQKTYGTLADDVMVQVLGETGIRKQTAQAAIGMMNELNIGRMPDARAIQQYSTSRASDLAHDAMMGNITPAKPQSSVGNNGSRFGNARSASASSRKAELPNAAHVSLLKSNPALAAQFDQRFGAGSSQQFLADHGQPIRRKLANGDIQNQYADGFIEVLKADGTIEGRPAQ